ILSGPRQPFPASATEGVRPGPGTAASLPQRPNIIPRQRPEIPREGGRPSAPQPAAPQPSAHAAPMQGKPLAGQPAARPVVPPRPDLAAKLGAPRPAMPAQPVAPRPG